MAVPIGAHLRGRLVRRYQRFLADVATPGGRVITVHCPDPGSMRGLLRDGAAVRCSTSDAPGRRLRHTLEMIRGGRVWVGTNPARANALAARAIEAGAISGLAGYARSQREVRTGGGSRLDLRLHAHARDPRPAFVEVKSVTLARGASGCFPDSVTVRGRRHLEELARLRREGARAVLLFVAQRADVERVTTASDIDPEYARALRAAVQAGVEVLAVRARVTPGALRFEGRLPVRP